MRIIQQTQIGWVQDVCTIYISGFYFLNVNVFIHAMNMRQYETCAILFDHDDVIKWKHFPRYCPFVRGIHRSPLNFSHKVQWHRALMTSLNCCWTNNWANNGDSADLRRHRTDYDVIVMNTTTSGWSVLCFLSSYSITTKTKIIISM